MNILFFYAAGKNVDCLTHFVRRGTILLTDEEFAKQSLEYGEQQLLLTVVTLILTCSRLVEVAYRDKIYIKANLVPLEAEFFRE